MVGAGRNWMRDGPVSLVKAVMLRDAPQRQSMPPEPFVPALAIVLPPAVVRQPASVIELVVVAPLRQLAAEIDVVPVSVPRRSVTAPAFTCVEPT